MYENYLRFVGFGIMLVALIYGVAPETTLSAVSTVNTDGIDQRHVYRGVMGLYFGMGTFWLLAVKRAEYHRAAVVSVICFMAGLAAGRFLSMAVDGMPSPFLVGAAGLEVAAVALGVLLLRQEA